MPRTPKGEVAISNKDGWIQLRWRHQGKRCYLSLGLRYDPVNLEVAKGRASEIRLDILSGNFDATLKKYRTDPSQRELGMGAVVLFERFIEWKAKRVGSLRTLEKYYGLVNWLREYFGDDSVEDEDTADDFLQWLMENLEPVTVFERLGLLKAAWDWGIGKELVTANPWAELKVRKSPKQKPKPFSKDEVKRIIQGFRESQYYRHYADYVQFKFSTGCRTGEVNGLRWRHMNEDCTVVWFGETFSHGEFKDTKNKKPREVKLAPSLAKMLRMRMSEGIEGDDLVFPAPEGGAMDAKNFSARGWSKVLEEAGIDYRSPYHTRHTFVSHALASGMNPVEVAAITGHNVKTLYENYAGLIKSHPETPELF